jgi:hypothetical protein
MMADVRETTPDYLSSNGQASRFPAERVCKRRLMMPKKLAIFFIGILLIGAVAFGQNFKGTYTMTSGTTKLTLVLNQSAGGQVTGTLTSTTGAVFKLAGKIEEDIVMGTCQGQAGTSQFEASFEGSELILTLIETSPMGEVTSRSLEFIRSAGSGGLSAELGLAPPQSGSAPPRKGTEGPKAQPPKPVAPAPVAPAPAAPPSTQGGANPVSDPEMGISFSAPAGWNGQKQGGAIYLTSTNYKGFIVITRHAYKSLQEMANEASQGIVDESTKTRLMPVSKFQPFGKNGMVAEFSGTAQGQKARTFAIGLISPQGGGVTIMAATEEASYSSDYSDCVLAIAGSLSFLPGGASGGPSMPGPQDDGGGEMDLMKYFAGEWYAYSSGSTISGGAGTERTMTLCPDGLFRDSSEFSASGGGWGAANAQSGWGRWIIQGDKAQGVIMVTYPNGQSKRITYRVISKQEQTMSFDGVTYAFAGVAKCR